MLLVQVLVSHNSFPRKKNHSNTVIIPWTNCLSFHVKFSIRHQPEVLRILRRMKFQQIKAIARLLLYVSWPEWTNTLRNVSYYAFKMILCILLPLSGAIRKIAWIVKSYLFLGRQRFSLILLWFHQWALSFTIVSFESMLLESKIFSSSVVRTHHIVSIVESYWVRFVGRCWSLIIFVSGGRFPSYNIQVVYPHRNVLRQSDNCYDYVSPIHHCKHFSANEDINYWCGSGWINWGITE